MSAPAIREITLTELTSYAPDREARRDTTELHCFARRDGGALAIVRRDHRRSAFEFEVLAPDDGGYRVVHRTAGISDRSAACAQAMHTIALGFSARG